MTVAELIEELNKFDPNTKILGEFDSDGDDFIIKLSECTIYTGNGCDDAWDGDDDEDTKKYCILRFDY